MFDLDTRMMRAKSKIGGALRAARAFQTAQQPQGGQPAQGGQQASPAAFSPSPGGHLPGALPQAQQAVPQQPQGAVAPPPPGMPQPGAMPPPPQADPNTKLMQQLQLQQLLGQQNNSNLAAQPAAAQKPANFRHGGLACKPY